MLLSEYIKELQKLLNKHGDHYVKDSYGDKIDLPEYNDADKDYPYYVLCETA